MDIVDPEKKKSLKNIAKRRSGVCCLSALTGAGVPSMIKQIDKILTPEKFFETLLVPFEFGNKKAWLHENGLVINECYNEVGYKLDVMWSAQQKAKFDSFIH